MPQTFTVTLNDVVSFIVKCQVAEYAAMEADRSIDQITLEEIEAVQLTPADVEGFIDNHSEDVSEFIGKEYPEEIAARLRELETRVNGN